MDDSRLDDRTCRKAGTGGSEAAGKPAITEVASQSFDDDAPLHRVVTFLNKSLRRRGFIFGLTRQRENELKMTIYEVHNAKL